MKLIGSHTSPFVRKVRVVLAEKKIEYDFVIDSPGWPTAVPNINPLGKIPVLVLDDETPLFDSRVIVEYIDNVTPEQQAVSRAQPRAHRGQALGSAGRRHLRRRRDRLPRSQAPAGPAEPDWIARQRDKITRSLEFMAEELGDKPYCMGTHFSLADIAVGTALGYLCFRFRRHRLAGKRTPTWPSSTPS
jgi:glutathione S-transferase